MAIEISDHLFVIQLWENAKPDPQAPMPTPADVEEARTILPQLRTAQGECAKRKAALISSLQEHMAASDRMEIDLPRLIANQERLRVCSCRASQAWGNAEEAIIWGLGS